MHDLWAGGAVAAGYGRHRRFPGNHGRVLAGMPAPSCGAGMPGLVRNDRSGRSCRPACASVRSFAPGVPDDARRWDVVPEPDVAPGPAAAVRLHGVEPGVVPQSAVAVRLPGAPGPREVRLPDAARRGELLRAAPRGWCAAASACQLHVVAVVRRASGARHGLARRRVHALAACAAWRDAAPARSFVPACLVHVPVVGLAASCLFPVGARCRNEASTWLRAELPPELCALPGATGCSPWFDCRCRGSARPGCGYC